MEHNFKVDGNKLYCRVCGNKVGWKFTDEQWLLSSNAEGIEERGICHTCLVEHCCNTNCLGCDWYEYPNCPHIQTKKIYMEEV